VDNLFYFLTLLAAIGCGLTAGLFFTFSNTVMSALARLPSSHGVAAMQSINRVILNALFFIVFFGTAAVCLSLGISLVWRWNDPAAAYLLAGCLIYLIGSILVTIVFNVPMNEALDKVKPESVEAAEMWSKYLSNWTTWNHVRTVACLLSLISFIHALA
jgi:uncharacterized membrane protein